ncbi:hypothetical protein COW36_05565 [bacterium (Candidatus Blackallbacteria) CG17_big_fil_post_rev_8_21_14_2_50_48_46]|uniref:Uncharacterized protein n=1 Tax=bacterium (Candidatus Blackallbacteria) CG17_big_fil_post_rev_8_21_14_2_50_48_46 TaxID=2014261 RepID=A0A2M7G824_9BACT|nr:MAG: hypothetical protein COW64_21160 [bacterium (Candidatus Blackallbacteria) CG18_big_fil_WC_8_21_14_2_50_49_26]PIW18236.1 MAG: hypothetical protein COW36_05565 [bacterium (Candidatus Blackallbacteria) CG17_big_fil_post_rev_8_21_14_2_50_48_46]PIW50667.1 MAG: hypothetical protein COW20_01830 [bacterium (Candidatus Blackallbacteria) CG13_big_fil_rev_8_21_14_2_50_49_14]
MAVQEEQIYLITYLQNGLQMRDRFFEEAEPARQHFHFLSQMFPEAQVKLHEISLKKRLKQNCCSVCY